MSLDDITKHPDLWYEDGTVVIVAENTGFRVYRGLLVNHSSIFHDMFLLPQPASSLNDTFEGCPVVRLADDSAEEVTILLSIICNGVDSFTKSGQRVEFSVIAAALRLGTKYAFHAIRQEALRRISLCYPKELKEFQAHGEELCDSPRCPIFWSSTDCIKLCSSTRSSRFCPRRIIQMRKPCIAPRPFYCSDQSD
ncbi:hypothetical protein BDY19DRAFT_679462 [Irpex rosettiformis]|uniref:Uncharacterized protein n=1 Tax=Irpex rosettiformis TaxID=378272 RepID=A0ACB8U9Y4_9APHY|nr:hypothetical protein BDY19DRAFT_679462 [Irpex rosettiformis]